MFALIKVDKEVKRIVERKSLKKQCDVEILLIIIGIEPMNVVSLFNILVQLKKADGGIAATNDSKGESRDYVRRDLWERGEKFFAPKHWLFARKTH
ncbi:predicted protein [Enterococcus casseliflavus EC30]|nr:predicted protein [Enterococcus casseliflavus EC30]EEV35516.1 predicted protein [Enterococcus casseliflavus EC10]